MAAPRSAAADAVSLSYVRRPLPALPRPSSRSSSIYSEVPSPEKPTRKQRPSDTDLPEQIYLQPTRFYSSASNLPVQKLIFYEQQQGSTSSSLAKSRPMADAAVVAGPEGRIKKRKELVYTVPAIQNASSPGSGAYRQGIQGDSGRAHGPRVTPRAYTRQPSAPSGVAILQRQPSSETQERRGGASPTMPSPRRDSQGLRPISRFSMDSDERGGFRSSARNSLLSYLSKLSSHKRPRRELISSGAGKRSSETTTSTTQATENRPATSQGKSRAAWSRLSLASLLQPGQGLVGGSSIVPHRAKRQSAPHTPQHSQAITSPSSQSPINRAITSMQRGATELKSGMTKARTKVTTSRAERRRAALKAKIRVVGVADQYPDGRVNWWI